MGRKQGKIWQGIKGAMHEKVASNWGKDFAVGARGMRTGRVLFAKALLCQHSGAALARGMLDFAEGV